jgi:hypothetical protein
MSFRLGENVGPYQIVAQLGSGGMATVFKLITPVSIASWRSRYCSAQFLKACALI